MSLFVTGTGTDVGKTVISTWLCLHTCASYWKPVQTGAKQGTDSAMLKQMGVSSIHPEACVFQEPLSPHAAAALEKQHIELPEILNKKPCIQTEPWIVEGAGGVYVPLNEDTLLIELIKQLEIPALVVGHSGLGTLNHTLLTLQALKQANIPVVGVVLNGPPNPSNQQTIQDYANIKVFNFEPLPMLCAQALQQVPLPFWLASIAETYSLKKML